MEQKHVVAMPSDLRNRNFGYILNTICRKKQFTITDIVHTTKMSRHTIAKALSELMELGIIVPNGKASSTNVGGKKPVQYALNDKAYVICMSAGEHKTGFSLMTLDYQRIDAIELQFLAEYSPEQFVSDSVAACKTLIERNHIAHKDFLGISYCMGGIVDEEKGVVRYAATVPEWGQNIEIRKMISEKLDFTTHLSIDNVCKICARTMISHDNLNQKNIAVFYCDYGMGITLIEAGTIHQTSHKIANEWGHMVVNPWDKERCGCGGFGCVEVLLGEKRIREKISMLSEDRQNALMDGYDGTEDIRIHVMKRSDQGNSDAIELMHYMADLFGITIRNVYLGIDPDYIVLLGAFAHCTESFLDCAREKARENLYLADVEIDLRRYPRSIRSLQEIGGVNTILRAVTNAVAEQQVAEQTAEENYDF